MSMFKNGRAVGDNFKGNVDSLAHLPSGASDGDLYLVLDIDEFREYDEPTLTWREPNSGFTKFISTDLHLWANGTTGNDANDGLTELTAKKTIAALFTMLYDTVYTGRVMIHLRGTFITPYANFPASRNLLWNQFFIDGGPDKVVKFGPFLADIHEKDANGIWTIGCSTAVLANCVGYMIRPLDGPCAGQIRMIHHNTATTVAPMKTFTEDPGPCNFDIVVPATKLQGDAYSYVSVAGGGPNLSIKFQRLYITGNVTFGTSYAYSGTFAQVINDPAGVARPFAMYGMRGTAGGSQYLYNEDFSFNSVESAGLACRWARNRFDTCSAVNNSCSVFSEIEFYTCNTTSAAFSYGSVIVYGCILRDYSQQNNNFMAGVKDYSPAKVAGSSGFSGGIGLYCINCNLKMDATFDPVGYGLEVSNCASHGIMLRNSNLLLGTYNIGTGVLGGSGNGGFGLHIHSGSIMSARDDLVTMTGTLGDITVDGTTLASTWAAIKTGTPLVDLTDFVMVKNRGTGS